MLVPDTHAYPDLFERLYLGSSASPGSVTISGHDRKESWDTQQPKGSAGATNKLNGRGIGGFRATFFLATKEEQDAWPAFQRVIESTTAGAEPSALPCYHPVLAANDFTEVSNAGVGGMIYDSKGGATVAVDFVEYRPPAPAPPAAATARGGTTGGAGSGTGANDYDPNRAAREQFSGLWDEAAAP
jgi:hypothetical protein